MDTRQNSLLDDLLYLSHFILRKSSKKSLDMGDNNYGDCDSIDPNILSNRYQHSEKKRIGTKGNKFKVANERIYNKDRARRNSSIREIAPDIKDGICIPNSLKVYCSYANNVWLSDKQESVEECCPPPKPDLISRLKAIFNDQCQCSHCECISSKPAQNPVGSPKYSDTTPPPDNRKSSLPHGEDCTCTNCECFSCVRARSMISSEESEIFESCEDMTTDIENVQREIFYSEFKRQENLCKCKICECLDCKKANPKRNLNPSFEETSTQTDIVVNTNYNCKCKPCECIFCKATNQPQCKCNPCKCLHCPLSVKSKPPLDKQSDAVEEVIKEVPENLNPYTDICPVILIDEPSETKSSNSKFKEKLPSMYRELQVTRLQRKTDLCCKEDIIEKKECECGDKCACAKCFRIDDSKKKSKDCKCKSCACADPNYVCPKMESCKEHSEENKDGKGTVFPFVKEDQEIMVVSVLSSKLYMDINLDLDEGCFIKRTMVQSYSRDDAAKKIMLPVSRERHNDHSIKNFDNRYLEDNIFGCQLQCNKKSNSNIGDVLRIQQRDSESQIYPIKSPLSFQKIDLLPIWNEICRDIEVKNNFFREYAPDLKNYLGPQYVCPCIECNKKIFAKDLLRTDEVLGSKLNYKFEINDTFTRTEFYSCGSNVNVKKRESNVSEVEIGKSNTDKCTKPGTSLAWPGAPVKWCDKSIMATSQPQIMNPFIYEDITIDNNVDFETKSVITSEPSQYSLQDKVKRLNFTKVEVVNCIHKDKLYCAKTKLAKSKIRDIKANAQPVKQLNSTKKFDLKHNEKYPRPNFKPKISQVSTNVKTKEKEIYAREDKIYFSNKPYLYPKESVNMKKTYRKHAPLEMPNSFRTRYLKQPKEHSCCTKSNLLNMLLKLNKEDKSRQMNYGKLSNVWPYKAKGKKVNTRLINNYMEMERPLEIYEIKSLTQAKYYSARIKKLNSSNNYKNSLYPY